MINSEIENEINASLKSLVNFGSIYCRFKSYFLPFNKILCKPFNQHEVPTSLTSLRHLANEASKALYTGKHLSVKIHACKNRQT